MTNAIMKKKKRTPTGGRSTTEKKGVERMGGKGFKSIIFMKKEPQRDVGLFTERVNTSGEFFAGSKDHQGGEEGTRITKQKQIPAGGIIESLGNTRQKFWGGQKKTNPLT